MKKTLLLLLLLPLASWGQSPYRLSTRTDLPLAGLGLTVEGLSWALYARTAIPAVADFSALQVQDLPRVERFTAGRWSPTDAVISHGLLGLSGASALSLAFNRRIWDDRVTILVMGLEVIVLTDGITRTAKAGVLRYRPYAYNDLAPWDKKLKRDVRYSFFSGHASMAASATFFAARVWCDYHPGHRLNAVVWTAAVLLPAITGFERVRAGRHFPTDVVAGYTAGAVIGYLVPVLHRRGLPEGLSVSPVTDTGLGFNLSWRF